MKRRRHPPVAPWPSPPRCPHPAPGAAASKPPTPQPAPRAPSPPPRGPVGAPPRHVRPPPGSALPAWRGVLADLAAEAGPDVLVLAERLGPNQCLHVVAFGTRKALDAAVARIGNAGRAGRFAHDAYRWREILQTEEVR